MLITEIARLTRELEAAQRTADGAEAAVQSLTRERDEARAALTHAGLLAAQAQHNALRDERDRLRALLRQVRYAPYDEAVDEPLVYLRVPIERRVWDAITAELEGHGG